MYLLLIGMTGFEPATPCSQGRCATKLRYIPSYINIVTYLMRLFNNILNKFVMVTDFIRIKVVKKTIDRLNKFNRSIVFTFKAKIQ